MISKKPTLVFLGNMVTGFHFAEHSIFRIEGDLKPQ